MSGCGLMTLMKPHIALGTKFLTEFQVLSLELGLLFVDQSPRGLKGVRCTFVIKYIVKISHSLIHFKMYIVQLLSTLNVFLLDGWMDGWMDEEP